MKDPTLYIFIRGILCNEIIISFLVIKYNFFFNTLRLFSVMKATLESLMSISPSVSQLVNQLEPQNSRF